MKWWQLLLKPQGCEDGITAIFNNDSMVARLSSASSKDEVSRLTRYDVFI